MKYIRKLPTAEELKDKYPLSQKLQDARLDKILQIKNILSGKDERKLLFIGPCSADREDAVLDYMERLAKVEEKVREKILIIPRVYSSKPRTKGTGYKGILHRPDSSALHDDLFEGIETTRKLHLHVIENTGLFCVDEMLYPESITYFSDLLAYVAVGARSVEDQIHRLTASGMEIPVGMKNPMDGDFSVLLNSIEAAQSEQSFIFRGWEVQTDGNPYAHAILRGFVDLDGRSHPNYHYEDICRFHDMYQKRNLKNTGVIIDCNHSNSNKVANEQLRIVDEVLRLCNGYFGINRFVKGFMVESYLEDGNQVIGEGVYGKSITDACIGWEKTERLIQNIAEMMEI